MKRFFAKPYLLAAFAVALFGAAGAMPAYAQSRDHTGSMMPFYYDATGGQVTGSWAPDATASRRLYMKVEARSLHRHHN